MVLTFQNPRTAGETRHHKMRLVQRDAITKTPKPYEVPSSQEWDGNDGSWSTFKITIGTPGQDFRVVPSTQSGQTLVVLPEGCVAGLDPVDCAKSRGAQIFNSKQSPGFLRNESSTWENIGQYGIDLEENLNITARGLFGYDKVTLGSAGDRDVLSLNGSLVGGVADGVYYLGHIPLGVTKTKFSSQSETIEPLINQLRNTSAIPTMSFAYTAGAKYRLKSVQGQLILGGYDPTRFEPNEKDFSFTFSTDPLRLLTVGIDSIIATNTLQGTQSLSSSAHFSLIDSTVSQLWLPRDICDAFERTFGLTYDPHTDLYLINATMRDQLQARNPSVTIKLIDSLEGATTNFTNIVLPYSAFDLEVSHPYYDNATRYFPIRRAANESQYTLGRTLLQEAYLIVDYERANFTVAKAAFTNPLPPADIVPILPAGYSLNDPSFSKAKLNTGAKAGIAVGCVAFAIILAVVALLLYRRRRQRRTEENIATHGNASEVAGTAVSELSNVSPYPHKIPGITQELAGTPRSELAGPPLEKSYISVNDVPQELETPSSTLRPRFEEVSASEYDSFRSRQGGEGVIESRSAPDTHGSRVESDNRPQSLVSPLDEEFADRQMIGPLSARFRQRESVVSPMTGKFHEGIM